MTPAPITVEDLHGYLDEALSEEATARIEQALRDSPPLRQMLAGILQQRDRGEHTVGAIWRRHRLSCPGREQLGSYLLGVLDEGLQDYVQFHLQTVGCPYCLANLADLQDRQNEPAAQVQKRRKKLYESSAGILATARKPRR
jgi:hypothetical protein